MAAVQAPRSRQTSSTVAVGLKIAIRPEANENKILVGAPITGTKDGLGKGTRGAAAQRAPRDVMALQIWRKAP